nr:hypothetical protein [Tanacetum cinerariifolium]
MRYEHPSITPETESDEVTESNAENLLPIPSKCEDNDDLDSSDDESLPDEDVPAEEFKIYSNPFCDEDKINSDKLDPHCFNVKSNFVESLLNRDTFIDFSSKFDFSDLLYDNSSPRPPEELNAEIADTIIESIPLLPIPVQDGNSQQEEINIVTSSDDVLPPSVENDDDNDDLLLEEVDLFISDDLIPPGIENVANDPEGDVRFLEELLIDDSILSYESLDSNSEVHPLISRPPPEPPDDTFDLEPKVISAVTKEIDEPDEHFIPGGEIFVSTKIEDDDYFPFMFVIRFFLPYFILPEISLLLLSAESENTIFDPVEIVNKQVIAPAKAVEKTCVTCGGAHDYYECIATDSNPSSVCAATGSYNQVSSPNRASHQIPPPGFAPVQNNPNRFNQNQGQGNYFNQANNFNEGNNFHNNQGYPAQMNNVLNFQN